MVDTLSTFRTTDDHAMLPSVGFSEPNRPSTTPLESIDALPHPYSLPLFVADRTV